MQDHLKFLVKICSNGTGGLTPTYPLQRSSGEGGLPEVPKDKLSKRKMKVGCPVTDGERTTTTSKKKEKNAAPEKKTTQTKVQHKKIFQAGN